MSRTQPKTPSRKGIAKAKRARKREEAEVRNAAYQRLPLEQKIARNSAKVIAKLEGTK